LNFCRFEEAVEPLTRCLRMANTLTLNELTWPGTDTKMEESMTNILQVTNIKTDQHSVNYISFRKEMARFQRHSMY
jgi:hypothetical protein